MKKKRCTSDVSWYGERVNGSRAEVILAGKAAALRAAHFFHGEMLLHLYYFRNISVFCMEVFEAFDLVPELYGVLIPFFGYSLVQILL
jgi:hypothetical protein